jgi:hypothetical protein
MAEDTKGAKKTGAGSGMRACMVREPENIAGRR